MTTRIEYVNFVNPKQSTLSIDPRDAKKLIDKYESDFPNYCFLANVENEISKQTKEKVKCRCGTQSYGNAKFCRECGEMLSKKTVSGIDLKDIDWHDDEYDTNAANTFFPIFVQKVVPLLRGHAECSVTFGNVNDDDETEDLETAYFVINNGELTWCQAVLSPGAYAPTFKADDLFEESDDDEDEDEDEDDDR